MSVKLDIENAVKVLRTLPKEVNTRTRRRILRKAAKPLLEAAKSNINTSEAPHHRYKSVGASKNIKAPKGSGNIVATYKPGNLKESIKILTFRKSKSAVFIGPKLNKRNPIGTFGPGGKVDGYYAHMVEFGTVNYPGQAYMRKAASSTGTLVEKLIIENVGKTIDRWSKKNSV